MRDQSNPLDDDPVLEHLVWDMLYQAAKAGMVRRNEFWSRWIGVAQERVSHVPHQLVRRKVDGPLWGDA